MSRTDRATEGGINAEMFPSTAFATAASSVSCGRAVRTSASLGVGPTSRIPATIDMKNGPRPMPSVATCSMNVRSVATMSESRRICTVRG